jgi:hypothetical protein
MHAAVLAEADAALQGALGELRLMDIDAILGNAAEAE